MNEKYILRISPSNDDFSTLKRTMEYLQKHHELGSPVIQPVRSINNQFIEKIESEKDRIHLVTASKQKIGKTHDLIDDNTLHIGIYYELGKNLAILHNNSISITDKEFDFPDWLNINNNYNILNPESFHDKIIVKKYIECREKCIGINKTKYNYGFIHGDIHFSNIIINYADNDITYCDFDDTCRGYYMMDMALLILDLKIILRCENKSVLVMEYINRMIKGYNDFTIIEKIELEKMQDFLKLLEISLFIQHYEFYDKNRNCDDWISLFINGRKERIIQNIPYCAD